MDPHVIIIGIVAFVVSAMMIYLISAFGFKEKSYEEAVAEQKKRLEAEQDKVKKEKKAKKEKLADNNRNEEELGTFQFGN